MSIKQDTDSFMLDSIQSGSSLPAFPEIELNGLKISPLLDIKWIRSMKDLKLRPDDVWVITYHKSGTTWTQQIVRLIIIQEKDDDAINVNHAVPWVEDFADIPALGLSDHMDIDKTAPPPDFKSHFPYEMMPCGPPSSTLGGMFVSFEILKTYLCHTSP